MDYSEFEHIPRRQKIKKNGVYGVGTNDADYRTAYTADGKPFWCPIFNCWKNILGRCYSDRIQALYPTYKGCTVDDRWLLFSSFREWMITQEWDGKHIDKDILFHGNKIYSPETCIFITVQINNLLKENLSMRGSTCIGVSFDKKCGGFLATVNSFEHKPVHLGRFRTEIEAHKAFCSAKHQVVVETANKEYEYRKGKIYERLIEIAGEILNLEYYDISGVNND